MTNSIHPAALPIPAADDRRPAGREVRHHQATTVLPAEACAAFEFLDDPARLAAHMGKPSLMMGGGRMTYAFDESRGMAVGALIRMEGSAFGLRLSVEEVVTERTPPSRKAWRTIGAPRLLIVGGYEMGFRLSDLPAGCELVVWIDFWPPSGVIGALLGRLLGGAYARWCVDRIVADATRAFGQRS